MKIPCILLNCSRQRLLFYYDIVVIMFLAIFYSFFAFDHLVSQGIFPDEAFIANCGMGIYKNIPLDGFRFITLFGKSFPLLIALYHGPISVYMTLPWLYLFGNTSVALHIGPVIFGLLTIPLFYFSVLLLYGNRLIATTSSILLFTSISYIVGCRYGLWVGTYVMFFAFGSIFCFLMWREKQKLFWIFLSVFSLGLGLGERGYFLWFLIALLVYGIATKKLFEIFKKLGWVKAGLLIICFCAAISPILLSLVINKLPLLRKISNRLVISWDGVNNLQFFENIKYRMQNVISLIQGTAFTGFHNRFAVYLFYASLIFFLIFVAYSTLRKTAITNKIKFPYFIAAVIFLLSNITLTNFSPIHIMILLPFICIMMGMPFGTELKRLSKMTLAVIVVIGTAMSFTYNCKSYLIHKAQMGFDHFPQLDIRWNVMSEVYDYIKKMDIQEVGIGDAGILDTLSYLSAYNLKMVTVFWTPRHSDLPFDVYEKQIRERLAGEKAGYYIFRETRYANTHFDCFNQFKNIVLKENKRIEPEKVFFAPNGEVVFTLYKVT